MSATMEALVLHRIGEVRLERIPVPEPEAGQARVRVHACGVCGSDLPRIFEKGAHRHPLVCGHELAGTVDACGRGVSSFAPGDRVAVFPLLWCDRCGACETGAYAQCEDYDYIGSRRDGGFADFVVAPERNLVAVPEGVTLDQAAMTEPAAVALHALRRCGRNLAGRSVLIFGAGPIGLLVAQWARAMSAGPIAIADVAPERLELAASLGLTNTINPTRDDLGERLTALGCRAGADVCVEAAGVPQAMLDAVGSCARGGTVVLLGNPSADVTLPAALISQVMRRELQIVGSWNSTYSAAGSPDDWRTALRAMASGALDLDHLISHRVSLADAERTLGRMRRREPGFVKVLFTPKRKETT